MNSGSPRPRISMVVATLGRDAEMKPLLDSLVRQGSGDFEVIVVDQNGDDRLLPLLQEYSDRFQIHHVRTPVPGVCRGRNLGASKATGEFLLFPDDDCWYPADFLNVIYRTMAATPADFYSGRVTNIAGEAIMGKFSRQAAPVTRANIWVTLIEWLVLMRRSTFEAAGGFDEKIGPGSGTRWGAHEIQDLILRCLKLGASGYYSPELTGHHPEDKNDQTTPENIAKMHKYSAGLGYVMRKHGFSLLQLMPKLMRPLAGIFVYRLSGKSGMAKRSGHILLGRLEGWCSTAPVHGPH